MLTYDRYKSALQGRKSTFWRNVLSRLRIQTTIPPSQASKITKDSDAYRLQSYEQQTRTSEIAFQKKKLGTAQTSTGFKVDSTGQLHIQQQSYEILHRLQTITPPLQRVELENQERLLRLTSISNPSKVCSLTWSIGDYQDVQIEDNSVIICDIPYIGTNEYVGGGDNFDHERFYEWCLKQKEPLYICSYEMPEKDFKVVAEFARVDTMSATNNGKLVSEKVFMPRTQETRGNIQLSLF